MSRHPYTYAADMLRHASMDPNDLAAPCTVSRAQASMIRQRIAKVIGMDDAELATKLSEAYQREFMETPSTPPAKAVSQE